MQDPLLLHHAGSHEHTPCLCHAGPQPHVQLQGFGGLQPCQLGEEVGSEDVVWCYFAQDHLFPHEEDENLLNVASNRSQRTWEKAAKGLAQTTSDELEAPDVKVLIWLVLQGEYL